MARLSKDECLEISDDDLKALVEAAKAAFEALSPEEQAALKEAHPEDVLDHVHDQELAQEGEEPSRKQACHMARLSKDECLEVSDDDLKELVEAAKAAFEALSPEEQAALKEAKPEDVLDHVHDQELAQEGDKPEGDKPEGDKPEGEKPSKGKKPAKGDKKLRGNACKFAGLSKDQCADIADADLKVIVENIKGQFEGMSEDEVVDALHEAKDELAELSDDELAAKKGDACDFLGMDELECDDVDGADLKMLVKAAKDSMDDMDEDDVRQVIREFETATQ